jgi:GMP synthase-like glutamine amidotransferase
VPHDVVGGEPLPAPDAFDAVLLGGSRHGVHDPVGWIDDVAGFVRAADAAGTTLVGVCFGHQLLADALGGRVARATNGWGVGVREARVVAPHPWIRDDGPSFRLLVSHQDQVVELPPGAELVATSEHAPIAVFRRGRVLGIQGHPEFVPAYADALMRGRIERIGRPTVEAARATLATPTDHAAVATWLGGFLAQDDRVRS